MAFQKAIGFGLDRTLDLVELPQKIEPRVPSPAGRMEAIEGNITAILGYLSGERERLIRMYDTLTEAINRIAVESEWREMTHDELTADQDDYVLGNGIVHRFSTDASRAITGFDAPATSLFIVVVNVGSNDLVLANESVASSAVNRIIAAAGSDITLGSNGSVILWYDGDSERWREIG